MIRWMSAGESHGQALLGIIDGVPNGVKLDSQGLASELKRRRMGYGRGARQKFEQDEVRIIAGVRHGLTTGSPVAIEIANSEWPKWQVVMSPDPVPAEDLLIDAGTGDERELARNKPLTRPRPGHADLPGMMKFDHTDARPVLERASARETATRVALGYVARQFLAQVAGIEITSQVVAVGKEKSFAPTAQPSDAVALDRSDVRTLDEEASARFIAAIDRAKKSGDTIAGVVEVAAFGVPVGLGSYTQWDQRLDANLAAALMSIQSAKSVEIGSGQVGALGSYAHDEIAVSETAHRTTNHAGGIEGGMSNGEPIVARVGFKPISTVPKARATIDLATKAQAPALHQRSDISQIVPAAVICESMVALTLANEVLKMFGTGSVDRIRTQIDAYNEQTRARMNP